MNNSGWTKDDVMNEFIYLFFVDYKYTIEYEKKKYDLF